MAKRYLLLVSQAWGWRLGRAYRNLSESGSVTVVAFSASARDELQSIGIEFTQVGDYSDLPDEFDLTRTAVEDLNDFPRRRVGGRSLGEWLTHRGIPLWPFVSPNLFADVNTQAKTLTILDKIIDREKPDCVVALEAAKVPYLWHYLRGLAKEPLLVDRLACIVALKRGIAWEPISPSWKTRIRHWVTNVSGRVLIAVRGGMCLLVIAALIRRILIAVASVGHNRSLKGGVHLFSHRKYWRREFNPLSGNMAMTDTAIYPIAKGLLEAGEKVYCLDGNYGFVGGLHELWQKVSNKDLILWNTFDSWYPLRQVWKLRAAASSASGVFAHAGDLEDLFSYGGYKTGSLFLPRLRFILLDYLWKSALWIEAGRLYIRDTKPDVVALTYETGTLSRAIINACHEEHVPCVGMQHGAFSESTDDYMRTSDTHIRRYVPDKTAVWGERFRRALVEHSAYSEEEVEVTGNPRMDFLVGAQSLLDYKQVYDKYGLDSSRRIVLAAPTETIGRTQHMAKDRFFDGVVAAARAQPETQWVVKLKPGADSKSNYRRRLSEMGGADLVLTEDDLYSLLLAADVVVTPPSSIAIEALLMRKPVIYIAFADAEDYFPHLSECGAVFTRRDMTGIAGDIEQICMEYPHGLLADEALEELVFEENYKPDGKAAERVVNLIKRVEKRSPASTKEEIENENTTC